MACALEDAGWELRDTLMWLYGSGFPKSKNIGGGYGTALKPAWEPIIMARKPPTGTVADNVQLHGSGALNIDGCRIPTTDKLGGGDQNESTKIASDGWDRPWMRNEAMKDAHAARVNANVAKSEELGRWPANVVHDGSDEVLDAFPDAVGQIADASTSTSSRKAQNVYGDMKRGNGRDGEPSANSANDGTVGFQMRPGARRGDAGSAARFFYCAKASREDRNVGMQGEPEKPLNWSSGAQSPGTFQSENTHRAAANHHPTVKPTELMRWLVRLVTPPGGTVLDPFLGSGSTARACDIEGFDCVGIEIDPGYAAIARKRISGDAPLFAEVAT